MTRAPIRIFLVDDHRLFLAGVRSELAADDIEIVGDAGDAATAIEAISSSKPDVVLLDVHLPDGTAPR